MHSINYKKIVLVDDHVIVRNGLRELIEKLGPYKVVSECNNGREFMNWILVYSLPDLVIMDLTMPELSGDEVVQELNKAEIPLPILILTLNYDEQRIIKLFRAGIRGFLMKDCTASIMKEALMEIFSTGFYHNEYLGLALKAPDKLKKQAREIILEQLTEKEKTFLRLVCHQDEYTYEQIASIMGVVTRTVDGYRESIFTKFDIKSKVGLVLFSIKNGIVDNF